MNRYDLENNTIFTRFKRNDDIWDYSNPEKAQNKAFRWLGKKGILFRSTRKDKKYMVKNPDGKWIHFGQMGYEDFNKHRSLKKRNNYLLRAKNISGDWKKDKYSPNNLAINILW